MLHPDFHCVDSALSWPERLDMARWLQLLLEACQHTGSYPHTQRLLFAHNGVVHLVMTCN